MTIVRQRFNNEVLTRTVVKNNILKVFNQTTEEDRRDWYQEAYYKACGMSAIIRGGDEESNLNKACGIIAALSPLKRWETNLRIAEEFIRTETCGHMTQFLGKALLILRSSGNEDEILEILSGNKISAFYLNIRYPHKAEIVTIDRHAISIAMGRFMYDEELRGITANQYEFFVQCYTWAALQAGVSPILMQSSTWCRWREIKGDYKDR